MSDSSAKTFKKNQRKRENRRKNKQNGEQSGGKINEENIPMKDPLTILKEKLAEAKRTGDHKAAAKYRQDIWVFQDVSAGIEPELEKELVASSLGEFMKEQPSKKEQESLVSNVSADVSPDKELKKIKKKLIQIEKLKLMKENGEKLEHSQIEKIEKEEALRNEAKELGELISEIAVTR